LRLIDSIHYSAITNQKSRQKSITLYKMEPRHHLKNPVELFTHCFHHRSAFHDDRDDGGDNTSNAADNNAYENTSTQGSHRKRNNIPAVTLFYDVDKNLTVAVLSSPRAVMAIVDAPLAMYFQSQVQQGTALQRSVLYYELSGYIRENYSNMQRRQSGGGSSSSSSSSSGNGLRPTEAISIAVGSLEASDEAQKKMLEEERRLARERRLHGGTTSASALSSLALNEEQFEQVMEIARLHRLNDDLDVLSVYFLRLVNKTCGRIATRIAQYQLAHKTTLVLSPYVDGVALSGYSNFNRGGTAGTVNNVATVPLYEDADGNNIMHAARGEQDPTTTNAVQHTQHGLRQQPQQQLLVRHREFGREIEYRQCQDIVLTSTRQNPAIFSPMTTCCCPEHDENVNHDSTAAAAAAAAAAPLFTWECEEIAFAVMHRWWGEFLLSACL
jgi:hypothetical protein